MVQTYGFLLDNGTARQTQKNALLSAGCGEIWFQSHFALELTDGLIKGDRLLIWRIDELELSVQEVVELVARLAVQGVEFAALVDGVDTRTNPATKDFCLSLTTMRHRSHSKRVIVGIERARATGQKVGRNRKLSPSDVEVIHASVRAGEISVAEAARQFGISRNTLQRYLSEARGSATVLDTRLSREQKLRATKSAQLSRNFDREEG